MGQRKTGHVTLSDVAQACGFSVSTVSIVLSEAPLSKNVAARTRLRIQAMAAQLGYHPDASARSLRRRHTRTIGVLSYDLSDPFCLPIVRGIQGGLQPAEYLPLLMDAQTQRKLFDRYLKMILEQRAEGVIVIASWVFEEAKLLDDMRKNNVPIVIVGRDLTEFNINSVLVDNEAGGAMAVRHLHELGHRKIAVIRGPDEMFDSEPRWAGARRAAKECAMKIDQELVFRLPGLGGPTSGFEGGRRFAAEMLALKRELTAVLAFDDLTALGVVRGLTDAGLRVPDDCSVVGFDDILQAEVATPGLTTIRQPLREMGLQAAEWVLNALRTRGPEKSTAALRHMSPPELIVRNSSARPPDVRRTLREAPAEELDILTSRADISHSKD
jgi:LacI family transcriptional regulator